jgi:hypothetical protein
MARKKKSPTKPQHSFEDDDSRGQKRSALERLSAHRAHVIRDTIPQIIHDYVADESSDREGKISTLVKLQTYISTVIHDLAHNAPDSAPQLWRNRPRSSPETPIDFISRVYGDYIGKGLTQADIRRLDFELYRSLQNWKQRYGWPKEFDLPTKQQSNTAMLAGHAHLSPTTIRRGLAGLKSETRLYDVARKRLRKLDQNPT